MAFIYLVRHGRVDENSAKERDPNLSIDGHAQARQLAVDLDSRFAHKMPVFTSPLRRCRETAAPLAKLWRVRAQPEPRVGEIPSPQRAVISRETWLKQLFQLTWDQAEHEGDAAQAGFGAVLRAWRRDVCEAIASCDRDSVMFTHFMPVNVVVGTALNRDQVVCFRPDNTSVTVVENSGRHIRLIELGREMASRVF